MKRFPATRVLLALGAAWLGTFAPNPLTQAQTPPPSTPARIQSPAKSAPQFNLFYTGKRRSSLEPCGCRRKQEGGLQYEATLYDMASPNLPAVKVDAGEWTNTHLEDNPVDALKSAYLLRAFKLLGMDAVNVGAADVQLSAAWLNNLKQKYPQGLPPLISANIFRKDHPAEHAFATHAIVRRKLADGNTITIGITGATSCATSDQFYAPPVNPGAPAGSPGSPSAPKAQDPATLTQMAQGDYLIRSARDGLAPLIAALRPKVDVLVVLYAGDFASGQALAKAFPQVNCVVLTRRASDPPTLAHLEGSVALFGVRLVRGGEVGQVIYQRKDHQPWAPAGQPQLVAVGRAYPVKPALVGLINEFKKATRTLDVKIPDLSSITRIYAGATRCSQCHLGIHQDWSASRHAHALGALVEKNQQFNPECLKCHVTGFRKANGFYTVEDSLSQPMFNVQCEVCHGPAKEHADQERTLATQEMLIKAHGATWMTPEQLKALRQRVKNTIPPRRVPETVCLKCHTPENDDHFVYVQKVQKINHHGRKDTETRRRGDTEKSK